jgi:hypothetical protein
MNADDSKPRLVDAKGAPVAQPEVPTEDQPKPQGPQIQCTIKIDLFDNGQLQINSNHLGNPMLMYGMLETAKDCVRLHQAQQNQPRVAVPKRPWWQMFGKNGQPLPRR